MKSRVNKGGLVFILSGPSGSGKTTLLKGILRRKDLKNQLARSVSLTTRPKRSGERDGRDYFFISAEQFKEARKAKKILEWTRYLGYYYATPKALIDCKLKRAKNLILCLDLKGAFVLKRRYPCNVVTIFVMPPSLDTLLGRITRRCRSTRDEEVRQRLGLAQEEVRVAARYDYCVVNKNLSEATRQLKDIILKEILHRQTGKS
ncbi:MAG: guanylate kinase [Candidatus Omnitrophota bacterium]